MLKSLHSPNSINSRTCSGEATISSLNPATNIPRFIHEINQGKRSVIIQQDIISKNMFVKWAITTVPPGFHESAVSCVQELTNHLFPRYKFPYMTFSEEIPDLYPEIHAN